MTSIRPKKSVLVIFHIIRDDLNFTSFIFFFNTGSLSDKTGTYNITFYLAGVTMFMAGALCVPLRRVARWEGLQTTVIQAEIREDEPEQSPMLNDKTQWDLNIEATIPFLLYPSSGFKEGWCIYFIYFIFGDFFPCQFASVIYGVVVRPHFVTCWIFISIFQLFLLTCKILMSTF